MWIPALAPEPRDFVPTPFGESMRRLYEEADWNSQIYGSRSRRWTYLHYFFGLATVILAATAGFGGLGALFNSRTAAWIALAAAVVAAISTFLRTDEQRKKHEMLTVAWDNFRQYVDNVYISAPGADERIQYMLEYRDQPRASREARSRTADSFVMPPDPEGWQTRLGQLQVRASALRRGEDTGETIGPWPRARNREPGRTKD